MQVMSDADRAEFCADPLQQQFIMNIGQTVQVADRPPAKVVGIDLYTCHSFAGTVEKWPSYTVDDGKNRYGVSITDAAGIVAWDEVSDDHRGFNWAAIRGVDRVSGYVYTKILGNAQQQSPHGGLVVYFNNVDTQYYCKEVFAGTKPLTFKGTRIAPKDLKLS